MGFINEMEKIFGVMYATNADGVDSSAYKLKDIAHNLYEEWEQIRGDNTETTVWYEFLGAFLDHFIPLELREAKY